MSAYPASHATEAEASDAALPGGRIWFYLRGLYLAYCWIVFGLCLRSVWPECPLVVRYIVGGFGFLATMVVFVSPYTTSYSSLPKHLRYTVSAAVVLAYTILGVVVLSSPAPSRIGAYIATVVACGIVLCGVNGVASTGKRGMGSRRAVVCGVVLTVLSLAGSMLPDTWFQLLASLAFLVAQLPALVGWPRHGWAFGSGGPRGSAKV